MDFFGKLLTHCENFRDRFIPDNILYNDVDLDLSYRYRLLTAMIIVSISVVLAFLLCYPLINSGNSAALIATIAICTTLILVLSALLYRIKKNKDYFSSVRLLVNSIFVAILMGILFTGGIHGSPTPVFLPLPVMLAFLLSDRKCAFKLCFFTAIAYALLMYIDTFDIVLPQSIAVENKVSVENMLWFYYSITFFILVILYDHLTQRLADQRQQEQRKLSYIARHDDLTGLANRKQFDEKLNEAIHRANRLHLQVTLFMIDLNDFKPINDLNGHHIGDGILKHVSNAIGDSIRTDDLAARIGGDEFAIVMQGNHAKDQLIKFSQRLTSNIKQPANIEDGCYNVSASIGIAHFPGEIKDEKHLRLAADMAMYSAKKSKEAFVFFDDLHSEDNA